MGLVCLDVGCGLGYVDHRELRGDLWDLYAYENFPLPGGGLWLAGPLVSTVVGDAADDAEVVGALVGHASPEVFWGALAVQAVGVTRVIEDLVDPGLALY